MYVLCPMGVWMYPLRHQEQQELRTTLTLLTNQRASQSANFGRVLSWSLFAKKAIDLAYLMRARTGSCSSARSTTPCSCSTLWQQSLPFRGWGHSAFARSVTSIRGLCGQQPRSLWLSTFLAHTLRRSRRPNGAWSELRACLTLEIQ